MVLEIPYSFVPGTKAKANEVNANFNAVKVFADTNETNIATNQADIQNLENNKADLNGNISNRFQVANPTGEYDAVNKQYFMDNIANTLDYIGGFKLTIQGNTSISASAGSCWDSTYEYMITSSTALTKDQSNLGQNATYYVYVCADKEGGSNELVFSLSNATPELPSGYDYFRMLGSFTTDSSGHISTVTSTGSDYDGSMNSNGNGWCKLPNGLQLVWGYTNNVNPFSSKTLYFYKAFPTNCFVVMLTPFSYGGRSAQNGDKMGQQAMVTSRTNTQFTVHNFGEQVYVNYAYLAIGN